MVVNTLSKPRQLTLSGIINYVGFDKVQPISKLRNTTVAAGHIIIILSFEIGGT